MDDFYQVDVVGVEVLKDYELHLQFEDGKHGNIDISKIVPFRGVFEPLKDKAFFDRVHINSDIGTICWDNGADLSPDYLYKNIQL